jgi:pilus assembly protein CpaF
VSDPYRSPVSLPLFSEPPPAAADDSDASVQNQLASFSSPGGNILPPGGAAPITGRHVDAVAARTSGGLDWELVRSLRQQAADRLTTQLAQRDHVDDTIRRELGRKIVLDLLEETVKEAVTEGREGFEADQQQRTYQAVCDALFGLGRLQPLVDDPDLENIEVRGCDRVLLEYAGGRLEDGPAIADTDGELIEFLQFLAGRPEHDRPFSAAEPWLNLRLQGQARLFAAAWRTPRPVVRIRRHRLVRTDLDELVGLGMFDKTLASLLRAAVDAGMSIAVSGPQASGKTTMLRALAACFDPYEAIATVETEYELLLHEMPDRHLRVDAYEGRPGSGERGPDGARVGEVTLDHIIYNMWRSNLQRLIVGEVRGAEVLAMFEAMQAGGGSLTTVHADRGRAAVDRLVTLAMKAGSYVTSPFAYRQVAEHIDLIVHLGISTTTDENGRRRRERYVSEVLALELGDLDKTGQPGVTDVYRAGPDGRAVPHVAPEAVKELAAHGFDLDSYSRHQVAASPAEGHPW